MNMHSLPTTLATPSQQLPTYDAKDLTQDRGQAHIVLNDQIYNLRITRAGKLILTK